MEYSNCIKGQDIKLNNNFVGMGKIIKKGQKKQEVYVFIDVGHRGVIKKAVDENNIVVLIKHDDFTKIEIVITSSLLEINRGILGMIEDFKKI